MKGMFLKIAGITGIIVILGVITMVALSPRAEGFFPDLLSFKKAAKEAPAQVEPTDSEPATVLDTLPQPVADTLLLQIDSLSSH